MPGTMVAAKRIKKKKKEEKSKKVLDGKVAGLNPEETPVLLP